MIIFWQKEETRRASSFCFYLDGFYNPFASRFFVCEYLYYIYTVGQIWDIYMLIVKRQGVYFPGKVYGVYSNYIALGSINFIFA